jgi:hypothetical protein
LAGGGGADGGGWWRSRRLILQEPPKHHHPVFTESTPWASHVLAAEFDEAGAGFGVVFRVAEPVLRFLAEPVFRFRVFLATPLFAFAVDLSIAKSSRFFPAFISAAIHLGIAPRPAHVSDRFLGLRYLGATLRRFILLPRGRPTAFLPGIQPPSPRAAS